VLTRTKYLYFRYTGQYCEKCDTCEGLCGLYRSCVHCKVFDNDCPKDESINPCFTNSSSSYLDIVRNLQSKNEHLSRNSQNSYLNSVSEDLEEELCIFRDSDDCVFKFSYYLDENRKVRLKVLDSKVKSKSVVSNNKSQKI
jgi:hypothetical protein